MGHVIFYGRRHRIEASGLSRRLLHNMMLVKGDYLCPGVVKYDN